MKFICLLVFFVSDLSGNDQLSVIEHDAFDKLTILKDLYGRVSD
jgi:hypothetical protein